VKNKLDFGEISSWQEFEDLVVAYFEAISEDKNIIEVRVEPSGVGSDGGRDILVTFRITDSIVSFERKWVVQCKFYESTLSKPELSTINIPTLIHEYGANGYLLVCKNKVSSKVTEMFENLRRECKLGYDYMIWQGSDLKGRIRLQPSLIDLYFPEHSEFLRLQERRSERP
jgi:Restriction endonuclease.